MSIDDPTWEIATQQAEKAETIKTVVAQLHALEVRRDEVGKILDAKRSELEKLSASPQLMTRIPEFRQLTEELKEMYKMAEGLQNEILEVTSHIEKLISISPPAEA